MSIQSYKDLIEAENLNGYRQNTFRKVPAVSSSVSYYYDLAVAPGIPRPKYWFDASPLVAQQVKQSTDGGIFHGADVAPGKKYLRGLTYTQNSSTAGVFYYKMILCDYLLYYPSVDESVTDEQFTDNTLTLPRYTDGKGVQVMAVNLASRVGNTRFTFSYTNQDGVSGRTSQVARLNSAAQIGIIATSEFTASLDQAAPFIGLQHGDYGVRSIESVTMQTPDTGLFALVLVKPLTTLSCGVEAPGSFWVQKRDKDPLMESVELTEVKDDAFLGLVTLMSGSTGMNSVAHFGDVKVLVTN